jgi:hypothetical protein
MYRCCASSEVRFWHVSDLLQCPLFGGYRGESVAKLFWAPKRGTLFQIKP